MFDFDLPLVNLIVLDPSVGDDIPLHVASPDWAISNEPSIDLPTTKHRYLSSSDDVGVCSSLPIMYFVEPSFHVAKHNSSSTRKKKGSMKYD